MQETNELKNEINELKNVEFMQSNLDKKIEKLKRKNWKAGQGYPRNIWISNTPKVFPG